MADERSSGSTPGAAYVAVDTAGLNASRLRAETTIVA